MSLGLLPIIATLIGLHFLPTLLTLGCGMAVSLAGLVYALARHRALNLFLLLGTAAITSCFLLLLFTGHSLLPQGSVTTTLEIILFLLAFLYITAAEQYRHLQERLRLKSRSSYRLEAGIIVILSGIHLLLLAVLYETGFHRGDLLSAENYFTVYIPPIAIYIICFTINAIGLRIALDESITRGLIRIAPVCDGKLCLQQKSDLIYDLPIEHEASGTPENDRRFAERLMSERAGRPGMKPRLILRHTVKDADDPELIELYIYPLRNENAFSAERSRFFSFDEIRQGREKVSRILLRELAALEQAAQMWQQYFKDYDTTCEPQ